MSRSEPRSEKTGSVASEALREELAQIDADLQESQLELRHAADELFERTRALDRSERLCEVLLSSVPTGVALVDDARIRPCNTVASKLLGLPRNRLNARLKDLREPFAKPVTDAVHRTRERDEVSETEVRVTEHDQVVRYRIRVVPFAHDDDAEVVLIVDRERACG